MKEIATRTTTAYQKYTAVTNRTTVHPTTLRRQRKWTAIGHKILDGEDCSLLIIRCGDLLRKADELGKDIAPALNPNKEHQYRINNAECYSVTFGCEKCADSRSSVWQKSASLKELCEYQLGIILISWILSARGLKNLTACIGAMCICLRRLRRITRRFLGIQTYYDITEH